MPVTPFIDPSVFTKVAASLAVAGVGWMGLATIDNTNVNREQSVAIEAISHNKETLDRVLELTQATDINVQVLLERVAQNARDIAQESVDRKDADQAREAYQCPRP